MVNGRWLIIQSRYHFLTSISIALFLIYNREYIPAILTMFAGWLIDGDHEIDYYVHTGTFVLNPMKLSNELGNHLYSDNKGRMYVPLHGWEWLILGIIFKLHPGILFSYFLHLTIDMIGNGIYPQHMSLLLRWKSDWRPKIGNVGGMIVG